MTATKRGDMLQIVEMWKRQGGKWPARISDIVDFALRHLLYDGRARIRQMLARDLQESMRESFFRDATGRPVRKLHAARIAEVNYDGKKVQRTFWNDIDTAPREFMEIAFQQRRQQIVGECCQLNNDVEYYNNRNPERPLVQMVFDFTDDVSERNEPDNYTIPPKG